MEIRTVFGEVLGIQRGNIIGKGANGRVYRAFDKNNKIFALKSLTQETQTQETQTQETHTPGFKEEYTILKTCSFPTIISLHGCTIHNFCYIVMDYMANGSVDNFFESQSSTANPNWNNTNKFIIIYGVALGMQYLHSKKITHCDLNSSNILLDENLFPRISDFGLSEILAFEGEKSKSSKGTWAYMAPEAKQAIVGKPYDGMKADVYAFGITIWSIFNNKNPQVCLGSLSCTNIPRVLVDLFQSCIADPDRRPNFTKIVAFLKDIQILEYFKAEERMNSFKKFFEKEMALKSIQEHNAKIWDAQVNMILGNRSYNGENCQQNFQDALKYYELAAEQGNVEALTKLGIMCEKGQGKAQNFAAARQLFEEAAAKGDCIALLHLGTMYARGQGVDRNLQKAGKYYQQAKGMQETFVLTHLGHLEIPRQGVEQDFAIKYFIEKIAEQENVHVLNNLGTLYAKGQEVEQDFSKAREFYQAAANDGYPLALVNLGVMYANGQGVEKDLEKAIEYFEQAAAQGNMHAVLNLAAIFKSDQAHTQDLVNVAYRLKNANML